MKSKIYRRFITTIALPSLLLALTFIASVPTYSVQATGGNETGATLATSGTWCSTILTLMSFLNQYLVLLVNGLVFCLFFLSWDVHKKSRPLFYIMINLHIMKKNYGDNRLDRGIPIHASRWAYVISHTCYDDDDFLCQTWWPCIIW